MGNKVYARKKSLFRTRRCIVGRSGAGAGLILLFIDLMLDAASFYCSRFHLLSDTVWNDRRTQSPYHFLWMTDTGSSMALFRFDIHFMNDDKLCHQFAISTEKDNNKFKVDTFYSFFSGIKRDNSVKKNPMTLANQLVKDYSPVECVKFRLARCTWPHSTQKKAFSWLGTLYERPKDYPNHGQSRIWNKTETNEKKKYKIVDENRQQRTSSFRFNC